MPAHSDGGRTTSCLGNVGRRGRVFFWVGFWRVPELHEPSHVAHQIESATAAETIAGLSAVIPQFLFGDHLAQGVEFNSRHSSIGRSASDQSFFGHLPHKPRGVVNQVDRAVGIRCVPAATSVWMISAVMAWPETFVRSLAALSGVRALALSPLATVASPFSDIAHPFQESWEFRSDIAGCFGHGEVVTVTAQPRRSRRAHDNLVTGERT